MQKWREDRPNVTAYPFPTAVEELLAIFLRQPELFRESKPLLNKGMFKEFGWVYESMGELDEQESFTFKTLAMKHYDRLEEIETLNQSYAGNGKLAQLIDQLRKEDLANSLYEVVSGTMSAMPYSDPNEVLINLQQQVSKLSAADSTALHDPNHDVDEHFEWIADVMKDPSKAYGLLTGIDEIDRITTGFHRGDFIVVGARTSIGKSAFEIEMALRLMKNGYKVAIYSLEMSKRQIYNRMLANLLYLDMGLIKTGRIPQQKYTEMGSVKEMLKKIYVDDTRGITADYIVDSMKRLKRTSGLDAVMVDYLQDVKEQGETHDNGGSAIARVCRKLRSGAQQCDAALFGLSQVKREVEDRKDKHPMPSDLAGSTGIETAADVIAMLYRDDYYEPGKNPGLMEVTFAKQRNGEVGKVELYYERRYQQLRPWATGRY